MKYLHDSGFDVLTVNDLGYDTKNNFLYIKPSVAQLTAANPVNLTKSSSINVIGMNGIVPNQSSAITQNNTALAPLSSNSSSYLSHPLPRVNHLSLPNSKSSTSTGISGSHPNGKSSKHHGYCSYSDYKSNACT
jgi:hypothetical protein